MIIVLFVFSMNQVALAVALGLTTTSVVAGRLVGWLERIDTNQLLPVAKYRIQKGEVQANPRLSPLYR